MVLQEVAAPLGRGMEVEPVELLRAANHSLGQNWSALWDVNSLSLTISQLWAVVLASQSMDCRFGQLRAALFILSLSLHFMKLLYGSLIPVSVEFNPLPRNLLIS